MLALDPGAEMVRVLKTGSKATKARARKTSARKGRKSAKTKRGIESSVTRRQAPSVADLQAQLEHRTTELDQALEQQTATAEVLHIISRSTFDVQTVLTTLTDSAARLCDAESSHIFLVDGEVAKLAACSGFSKEYEELLRRTPLTPGRGTLVGRTLQEGGVVHLLDAVADKEYQSHEAQKLGRFRTMLGIPMLRDGVTMGVMSVTRSQVRSFTDRQIALLQTFADQAVIAIENARLITETREALERQTATAEVLQVINSSPADLAPVFETILEKAHSLCGVSHGSLQLYDGEKFHAVAVHGLSAALAERLRQGYVPGPHHPSQPLLKGKRFAQVPDCAEIDDPIVRAAFELADIRTVLFIPLRRDGSLLGQIAAARREAKLFTATEIAVLENFAAQAVVAMENARLLTETRESLERQTATSEVLQVINSSLGDLKPVFEAMLDKAMRLCEASFGGLGVPEGELARWVALRGVPEPFDDWLAHQQVRLSSVLGPALRDRSTLHVLDVRETEGYRKRNPSVAATVELGGVRTSLLVPLVKNDALVGVMVLYRKEVRAFSDKQIELVQNFAAQAVIAIENARLLNELRQRTKDLSEALEQQTATSEVLKVISSSPGELKPVFQAMLESAVRICGARFGNLFLWKGDGFRVGATHGAPPAYVDYMRDEPLSFQNPNVGLGLMLKTKKLYHVADIAATPTLGDKLREATINLAGARTLLGVPMLKGDKMIGAIVIYRQEVLPFSDKQIELVQNFAAQSVIAIENTRLLNELRESLQQQTATADVLKVISRSAFELGPVLQAVASAAVRLCRADQATIYREENGEYRWAADHSLAPDYARIERNVRIRPSTGTLVGRVALNRDTVQILDAWTDPLYEVKEDARVGGVHTMLGVPLLRDGLPIGVIGLARRKIEPYTEKEIALVRTFADQAVIAIENARLLTEQHEALERQTATAEVLQVINSSPGDLAPVFDVMLQKALSLCGAAFGQLVTFDGVGFRAAAWRGYEPGALPASAPLPGMALYQLVHGEKIVHIPDITADDVYRSGNPIRRRLADEYGGRTAIWVALRKDEQLLGAFVIFRTEVRPFSDKQIALLQGFADQAVIAIENARLLEELRDRQAELARSVDELTATGDVLKIISRSSVELETVLDTLVETVARLCRSDQAYMFRRRGDIYHLVAEHGASQEAKEFFFVHPLALDRGTISGRVGLDRRVIHVPDVLQDPEYTYTGVLKITGGRTLLGIPLLREDRLIGVFVVVRTHVDPFTDKEIELATSFTDQAVIAIENARLFEELRDRQAELRVTFDNMGDGVVMFGADTRLVAWNRNFQTILDLPDAFLSQRPSYAEYFRYLADRGEYSADLEADLNRANEDPRQELRIERTRPDGQVIEVRRNPVPDGGFVLIYADITERKRAEEAVRLARDAAETALRELQTAQASLVHAQKMAALGQVTAGIAHEIKNPLNFVNNFAGLSVELLDELKAAAAAGALDPGKRAEIVETIGMLTGNLEKIVEHGRRADGIVRSMLQHSRGGSDDRQPTDLNALAEEALNLAYHGARAQDPNFDIDLERDLDRDLAPVDVVPQELTRVLLNLIGNGFYAANQRSRESDGTYRPTLKIATREFGESVEVRVRDNGIGILSENRDKLFQPFFTTKPTGEGTGLGLSISYEIITQQHGGTITVDSEVGDFTEFTVRLPRSRHAKPGRSG
jgi:PAS domain S-box-containing protein